MNNDTNTIEERSAQLERIALHDSHCGDKRGDKLGDTNHQAGVDEELQWICLKVLALCREQPPATSMGSPRQIILFLSNTYDGIQPQRFEMLCQGLYLMAKGHFRLALGELTPVLVGRVEPEFELYREVALQAHTFCLQQLGYDEEALEDFTALLVQKFHETREHGEADHIARLLGLADTDRRERRRAAIEC